MNDWLERNRPLVLVSIGALVAISIGFLALSLKRPAPITIDPPRPTATPGPIRVHVSGAVNNPDVYELPPDSIARDAIEFAGGGASDADLDRVNLARVLADGDQVYVPVVGETPLEEPPGVAPAGSTIVNINTATQAELETLPGIGPALAGRILDYREANGPFPDVESLQNVSGIGPATLEEIRNQITVQ